MSNLDRAIVVAVEAHRGKQDKGGQPYILHPLRVMVQMRSKDEQIAAVLHDVVEDSNWTFDQLRAEGFSAAVIKAIDALTRRDNEPYDDFIRRARTDPIAHAVKVTDLRDNMDLSRIPEPTEKDRKRMKKYRRALALLSKEETV